MLGTNRMKRGEPDLLKTQVEMAIGTLQEYRTSLVTAAATGKIDVRNAIKLA